MKNWKDQIGEYFMGKGVTRNEDMDKMLTVWIKEWAEYMDHFDYFHTKQGKSYLNEDYSQKWHYVMVMDSLQICPFKAYLGFFADEVSGNLCLKIKSAINVNSESIIMHYPRGDDRLLAWTDFDICCEPEIFEKEYVMGLLNSRFIRFNDRVGLFG